MGGGKRVTAAEVAVRVFERFECDRFTRPPFAGGESAYFMSINRNKQSICVDFHKETGRQLIVDLAKQSDVLLENYLPGKLDEIGLGYDQLKAVNPRLIYCSYVRARACASSGGRLKILVTL